MTVAIDAPARPQPIAGAEWQAGVTAGNESLRPLLDGKPVPFAIAASSRGGWVMCYLEPVPVRGRDGYVRGHAIPTDNHSPATIGSNAGHRTLRGRVQIVPGE